MLCSGYAQPFLIARRADRTVEVLAAQITSRGWGLHGLLRIQRDWGITVVRVAMRLILLVAGYKKFAVGVGEVAAGFEKIPIPLPGLAAPFISTLELVGGGLLILGLGTRWLGLLFAYEHLVTAFWVSSGSRDGITVAWNSC